MEFLTSPKGEVVVENTESLSILVKHFMLYPLFHCFQVIVELGGERVLCHLPSYDPTCFSHHVVSGTPGDVLHMIRRLDLNLRSMKMLVLDEADEMFHKGFEKQIYEVHRSLPDGMQVNPLSPFSSSKQI